jgi:hypothetical protein
MSSLPAKGFRTVAIETDIPWPASECAVTFRGREFHILPGSDKLARMIRVRTELGFTQADADKLILELLSSVAWAQQGSAYSTTANWATVAINIGRGPPGAIGSGSFDYLPEPQDSRAKLALALYREGLSLNSMPFQFLGFFKVVNLLNAKSHQQTKWISDNLKYVTEATAKARLTELQLANKDVASYLFVSGRCAIAHAFAEPIVNPDDPADLTRIHSDLPLMKELARIAIEREFKVKSSHDHFLAGGGDRA